MIVEKTLSITIPRPEDNFDDRAEESVPVMSGRSSRNSTMRSSRRSRFHSTASLASSKGLFSSTESRRTLAFAINGILLVSSLILIGTGSGLMCFYRIHLLEVITADFLIVPIVLTGGGIFTLLISVFGFAALAKEDSCLMYSFGCLEAIDFLILVAGIISSVRLLYDIQIGFLDADVITELGSYETSSWVRYKWDTIQREFTCCGGYGYNQGYTDWKHTTLGAAKNSVPDSCCLVETPGCGNAVFQLNDIRVTIGKINVHGCLTVMQRRLETHVSVVLIVFSCTGGILAILQLLVIVLVCCLLTNYYEEDELITYGYDTRMRDSVKQDVESPEIMSRGSRVSCSGNETMF